jgi:hypothetical protein
LHANHDGLVGRAHVLHEALRAHGWTEVKET